METQNTETKKSQPDSEFTASREQQTLIYQNTGQDGHRGPPHIQSQNEGFERREDENLPMKQMLQLNLHSPQTDMTAEGVDQQRRQNGQSSYLQSEVQNSYSMNALYQQQIQNSINGLARAANAQQLQGGIYLNQGVLNGPVNEQTNTLFDKMVNSFLEEGNDSKQNEGAIQAAHAQSEYSNDDVRFSAMNRAGVNAQTLSQLQVQQQIKPPGAILATPNALMMQPGTYYETIEALNDKSQRMQMMNSQGMQPHGSSSSLGNANQAPITQINLTAMINQQQQQQQLFNKQGQLYPNNGSNQEMVVSNQEGQHFTGEEQKNQGMIHGQMSSTSANKSGGGSIHYGMLARKSLNKSGGEGSNINVNNIGGGSQRENRGGHGSLVDDSMGESDSEDENLRLKPLVQQQNLASKSQTTLNILGQPNLMVNHQPMFSNHPQTAQLIIQGLKSQSRPGSGLEIGRQPHHLPLNIQHRQSDDLHARNSGASSLSLYEQGSNHLYPRPQIMSENRGGSINRLDQFGGLAGSGSNNNLVGSVGGGGIGDQDDLDQERSEAELLRRKNQLLEKLDQFDDNSPLQIIKSKQKSLYLQTRSTRGSRFRGVSRNGKKWQVMIVKGIAKKYLGAIGSEQRAARLYDKYAIIIQGLQAKTNFSYTKREIVDLLDEQDEIAYENDSFQGSNSSLHRAMMMGGMQPRSHSDLNVQLNLTGGIGPRSDSSTSLSFRSQGHIVHSPQPNGNGLMVGQLRGSPMSGDGGMVRGGFGGYVPSKFGPAAQQHSQFQSAQQQNLHAPIPQRAGIGLLGQPQGLFQPQGPQFQLGMQNVGVGIQQQTLNPIFTAALQAQQQQQQQQQAMLNAAAMQQQQQRLLAAAQLGGPQMNTNVFQNQPSQQQQQILWLTQQQQQAAAQENNQANMQYLFQQQQQQMLQQHQNAMMTNVQNNSGQPQQTGFMIVGGHGAPPNQQLQRNQ